MSDRIGRNPGITEHRNHGLRIVINPSVYERSWDSFRTEGTMTAIEARSAVADLLSPDFIHDTLSGIDPQARGIDPILVEGALIQQNPLFALYRIDADPFGFELLLSRGTAALNGRLEKNFINLTVLYEAIETAGFPMFIPQSYTFREHGDVAGFSREALPDHLELASTPAAYYVAGGEKPRTVCTFFIPDPSERAAKYNNLIAQVGQDPTLMSRYIEHIRYIKQAILERLTAIYSTTGFVPRDFSVSDLLANPEKNDFDLMLGIIRGFNAITSHGEFVDWLRTREEKREVQGKVIKYRLFEDEDLLGV